MIPVPFHLCVGCRACELVCPQHCIRLSKNHEGFYYPIADESRCNGCQLCIKTCPMHKVVKPSSTNAPFAFAAMACDFNIRKMASSGGIFPLLAQQTVRIGGTVYGARFNEHFQVIHARSETWKDCQVLFGSKYTQSDIGNAYANVKADLNSGRSVLFSGTPCQVAGLHSYLDHNKKLKENLFCCDFLCHGVLSGLAWQRYLQWQEQQAGSQVTAVSFRDKQNGWKNFSILIYFKNGKQYSCSYKQDLFFGMFLADVGLRECCYNCQFRTLNRPADLTLADFWGIWKVYTDMDDNSGTSLVLCHTEKGIESIHNLATVCRTQPVQLEPALKYNRKTLQKLPRPWRRSSFYQDIETLPVDKLFQWYKHKSLWRSILCLGGDLTKQWRHRSIVLSRT